MRVVLEVDGKQNALGETASPRLSSDMMVEDRLRGYEVYRFGGHELNQVGAADMLRQFLRRAGGALRHAVTAEPIQLVRCPGRRRRRG